MRLPRLQLPQFFFSVRLRLALWFTVVLAFVLLFFSGFIYYRQAQDIRDQAAARVLVRMREINNDYLRTFWLRKDQNRSDEQGGLVYIEKDEVLVLSDIGGDPIAYWGSVTEAQAKKIAGSASYISSGKASGRFIEATIPEQDGANSRRVTYVFSPASVVFDNLLVGYIILGQPKDPEGRLPRLVLNLALGGAATLLIALLGGYWLADRALWPVKAITRTAQEISETDLSQRLNIQTRDELGQLAGTFDRMLDRLEAAFNRQRQFTADASHELRTPLTIIGLETDRALAGAEKDPQTYRRSLEVIRSENTFMSRLVGELLILARMDSGQLVIKREPLDLSDAVLEVVERYEQIASQREIHLETGSLPELPVQGDRAYILHMVSNLVDNAIKYSIAGSHSKVLVETGKSELSENQMAYVRVVDQGIGIPPEHISHLFERFYRVDQARSHNLEDDSTGAEIPGSGLGLSIVEWVAQSHGGSVSVQSEPGKGSTFEVYLPLIA